MGLFALGLTPWTPLWDRDEPLFARAALELARGGSWLVPTVGGEPWLHKPPLATWLMAVPLGLLGPSPAAARCVSALALALAAYFTGRAAVELGLEDRAARLAPLLLAFSPLALVEGTLATVDALLLAALCAALAGFARLLRHGPDVRRTAALAAALAAAFFTKGPAAFPAVLAMSAAIAGASLDLQRRVRLARSLAVATGAGLLAFLAWFLPANAATGGRLLREGLGHQVGDRLVTPLEGHGGSWLLHLPYYLPVVLLGFLPWSYFLPAAIRHLPGLPRPVRATLLAWFLVPFAAVSVAATKLPHYVLPAFPALALAVAAAAAAGREPARRALAAGTGLALLGLAAAALRLPGLRGPLLALGLALLATATGALRREPPRVVRTLLLGTALSFAVAATLVAPAVERPVARLAARVRHLPGPAAAAGFHEPSLLYELDRPRLERLADEDALAAWARQEGPGLLVATRERLAGAERRHGPLPLREVARETGLDVVKGRTVTLVALVRERG